MSTWRNYLGLPHVLAADPADGKGADCLVLAFSVLDELGKHHPPLQERWFELARRGIWNELETIWRDLTTPIDAPENGAVTLIRNGPAGLGVAVVIDDGLLMVHHRRGVVWVPLRLLTKTFTYRLFN